MSAALLGKNFIDLNRATVMQAVEEYLNCKFKPYVAERVSDIQERTVEGMSFYRFTLEAPKS